MGLELPRRESRSEIHQEGVAHGNAHTLGKEVRIGSGKYELLLTGHWYELVLTGKNGYSQVRIGTDRCELVMTGTNWYWQVRIGTDRCELVLTGSSGYWQVRMGTHTYEVVLTGTSSVLTSTNGY